MIRRALLWLLFLLFGCSAEVATTPEPPRPVDGGAPVCAEWPAATTGPALPSGASCITDLGRYEACGAQSGVLDYAIAWDGGSCPAMAAAAAGRTCTSGSPCTVTLPTGACPRVVAGVCP